MEILWGLGRWVYNWWPCHIGCCRPLIGSHSSVLDNSYVDKALALDPKFCPLDNELYPHFIALWSSLSTKNSGAYWHLHILEKHMYMHTHTCIYVYASSYYVFFCTPHLRVNIEWNWCVVGSQSSTQGGWAQWRI